MRRYLYAGLVAVIGHASAAQVDNLPEPVTRIIDQLRTECTASGDGTLHVRAGAVSPQPLSGYSPLGHARDWVVDERYIVCSSTGSACGTGGCLVHFVVGEVVTTRLARRWRLTELGGHTVVLLERHGGACGTAGADLCFEALAFGPNGRATSVGAE